MISFARLFSTLFLAMCSYSAFAFTDDANLNTDYYSVNPNGQFGKRQTLDVTFNGRVATNAMNHWEVSDIIAQGVARDVCNAIRGMHERPVFDSYAIYAAYDNDYLYLGLQTVYTIWDIIWDGKLPYESKPYNMGGRMAWAFDLNPSAQFDGYIDGKGAIWNDTDVPGAKFNNGVDAVWMGSTIPGVGTPGFFIPTPDGHASYEEQYCKEGNVEYGYYDCLHPTITNIYGQSNFGYDPIALTGNEGFADLISEVDSTAHTFYEWKFPLSLLGVTADYIEEFGIGVMYLDFYGSSPIGGTPYDPSFFDNASDAYSPDPATSKEKEDEDVITYAPARIGGTLSETGIEDTEVALDKDAPVEYYNLMGVRIDEPATNEVFIERSGSKVTKKFNHRKHR